MTISNAEAQRRRRQKCKDEGRCAGAGCGKPMPEGDTHAECAECREKAKKRYTARKAAGKIQSQKDNAKRRRQELISQRRCPSCTSPLPPDYDKVECQECAAKNAERYQRRTTRRLAEGACATPGCTNKPEPGRRQCEECYQQQAARAKARRDERNAQGLCGQCGEEPLVKGHTLGRLCLSKMKEAVQARLDRLKAEGICIQCGVRQAEPEQQLCVECNATKKGYYYKLRREVFDAYGGPVCVGCGDTTEEILQIDHIDGGGAEHAREIGGRYRILRALKDLGFPPGFRILCPSCNWRAAKGLPFPSPISGTQASAPPQPSFTVKRRSTRRSKAERERDIEAAKQAAE